MKLKYPNYDNSILSVTNSILKHYGLEPHHKTLPQLDSLLENDFMNVVLFVFDGLGVNVLEQNLDSDSFFRQNILSEINSVYPCTTTAALTSIISGLTPLEHGWIGWSCYFNEVDKCVDLFSGNISGISEGLMAASEHISYKYLNYDNILSQIGKASSKVKAVEVSPFSDYFADTCEGVCEHILKLCEEDEKKFIYAYHFQPDHDIHEHGITKCCVREMIEDFDAQIKKLVDSLEDTLFIITADHGMTDVEMKCVEDYPHIYECLRLPISIEPRCCNFFIKSEFVDVFPERFRDTFGDKFMLFTHEEFLEKDFLGNGEQHKKIKDFIGDYIAVAVSDIALWYRDNNGDFNDFKAAHAGLCSEEMIVPLIVVERT